MNPSTERPARAVDAAPGERRAPSPRRTLLARRRPRRPAAALGLAVALGLAAGACGTSTPGATSASTTSTAATGTGTSATSYPSIAALQQRLTEQGITCTLEYAGLRDDTGEKELSICVIDGEQAYLTIWLQPGLVDQFLASPDGATGTVAVGANWTVVVSTPATAAKVAQALGGRAPSAPPATTR